MSVVLVTGATGAIGSEIAAQAAAAGAAVCVHGSRPGTVAAAIDRLHARAPGSTLFALPGDFRETDGVQAVVDGAVRAAGKLDAVIHCAVTGAPNTTGMFSNTEPANYGLLLERMLGTFQQLCFSAIPHLRRTGGAIVAIATDSGRFAAPRQAMLGAVHGGIMSFVRNLSVEIARDGVRINCISLSFVTGTPIFEAFAAQGSRAEAASARAGLGLPSAADIAPMALFLCGPHAAKITGQVVSINGGLNA